MDLLVGADFVAALEQGDVGVCLAAWEAEDQGGHDGAFFQR